MRSSIGALLVSRSLGFLRARFESRSNRAFLCSRKQLVLAASLFAGGAVWADADCDALPEAEQPLCRILARCEALADEDAKDECLRTARALGAMLQGDDAGSPTEAAHQAERPRWRRWLRLPGRTAPEQPETASAPVAAAPEPDPAPPPAKPEPAPVAPPAPSHIVETDANEVGIAETVVDRTVFDIPRRFEGSVTAFRRLVRDRQLIAVDDRLLFLGDVADESNIEVGDTVLVRRTSSMFGGERYIITGPSERSIAGRRILCERIELNKVNRNRCATLVGTETSPD